MNNSFTPTTPDYLCLIRNTKHTIKSYTFHASREEAEATERLRRNSRRRSGKKGLTRSQRVQIFGRGMNEWSVISVVSERPRERSTRNCSLNMEVRRL